MEVKIVGTTEGIRNLEDAKRYCQDFARVCYTEKDFDELIEEDYNDGLVDKGLIARGHHSPFDHFQISFYVRGLPKAVAMVLNNQRPYVTSEKSARYTVMKEGMAPKQRDLYDKWQDFYIQEINRRFSKEDFPRLYKIGNDGKSTAEKLSQENARYMTSVFTSTKMAHTISLRQINILMHWFDNFVEENKLSNERFKQILAEGLKQFKDSKEIKMWEIPGLKMKGNIPLRFFGTPIEEHFGDTYSINGLESFASLAQNHRHRLSQTHISNGYQKGAPLGFYIPLLVLEAGKEKEWKSDLESVCKYDFPQAQLLMVAERGLRENLRAKTEERICTLAQLETAHYVKDLIKKYAKHIPEMAELLIPICKKEGCKKGGCHFGPDMALDRLI
jgi:hypothetical protein